MKGLITIFLMMISLSLISQEDTIKIKEFENIDVQGVRADKKTPISQKTISKEDIDLNYHSQELPLLLNNTPSITTSTDGGHNTGYVYFRLRGIDQTRINMTLDGVPLNEPEDQGAYFSNYPDFINSIESIQIQRGVGTSTNGVSSYAGSINFESPNGYKKYTEAQIGYGSFNSYRTSIEHSTGLNNNFSLYSRFSMFGTDGYRYHSGSEGQSFFLSGVYKLEKSLFKITAFTGRVTNGMSWMPSRYSDIEKDHRHNSNTENEHDRFKQSFVSLNYKKFFNQSSISTTIFYNRLDGDWTLDLSNFGVDSIYGLLDYILYSNFTGIISNYNFKQKIGDNSLFRFDLGISGNLYERNHSMIELPSSVDIYNNKGKKNEASSFTKIGFDIGKLTTFVDLQIRHSNFSYNGDMNMKKFNWNFFNPKGGLMYNLSNDFNLYLSVGESNREPTRTDIFIGEDNPSVYRSDIKHESVVDYEFGINLKNNILKLQANLFFMDFTNEITPTGNLGENGLPILINVDKSLRTGLETDISLILFKKKSFNILLTNTSTLMYSEVTADDSLFGTQLYTPNFIMNQGIYLNLNKKLRVGLDARYTSKSYMSWEIQNETTELKGYFVINSQIDYKFYKEHSISLRLNNLTNEKYYTNGTYDGERSLFVNPPFNFFLTLKVKI